MVTNNKLPCNIVLGLSQVKVPHVTQHIHLLSGLRCPLASLPFSSPSYWTFLLHLRASTGCTWTLDWKVTGVASFLWDSPAIRSRPRAWSGTSVSKALAQARFSLFPSEITLAVHPGVGTPLSWVRVCLACRGTARLCSRVAAPFYVPASAVRGFQPLRPLTNACYYLLFRRTS